MIDKKNLKKISLILLVIIILQALRIVYVFAVCKEGKHSDEIWSYGLANSYFQPYIYMDDNYEYINNEKWISGEELKRYITVQEKERFAYDSVVSNMKKDLHPPFYFFVLHTVSSLFPDVYSRWFGFLINLVCFFLIQLYLYKLTNIISGSEWKALIAVLLFGFLCAGVNVCIFVRHYAMAAMFLTMTLYYHAVFLMKKQNQISYKTLLMCGVSSMLSMLTLYTNAILTFILAATFCVYLLIKKTYKNLLKYSLVMLLSAFPVLLLSNIINVIIGVANTAGSRESITNTAQISNSLYMDIRVTFNSVLYDFVGVKVSSAFRHNVKYYIMVSWPFLLVGLSIYAYFRFVKRRKKPFTFIFYRIIKRRIKKCNHSKLYFVIVLFVLVVIEFCLVVKNVSQVSMGSQTDRYLFPVFPIITLLYMLILVKALEKVYFAIIGLIKKRTESTNEVKSSFGLSLFVLFTSVSLLAFNAVKAESQYLFKRPNKNNHIEDLCDNKKIALFLSDEWLLTCYADLLYSADRIYVGEMNGKDVETFVKYSNTQEKADYIAVDVSYFQFASNINDALLKPTDSDKIVKIESMFINRLKAVEGEVRLLTTDTVFGRTVFVYEMIKDNNEA